MSRTKEQISCDLKRILVTDLGLDPVAHIELFQSSKTGYGIKVNTEDYALADQFRTVQSTTDYVWNSIQLMVA